MPNACRIGDIGIGICYLHDHPVVYTTTIVAAVNSVLTNGLPTATIGSIGCASCGHSTVALTGSGDTLYEGKGVHRIGDIGTTGAGTYHMVSGSPDTIVN